MTAGIASQTSRIIQVFTGTRERDCQVINADFGRGNDIGFIFFGQRFGRETAA